ncbi:MAG: HmuY family protein [Bacteroidales bacterium]|nr:HmuY family protein [Bacteroidales bacterium]MDD3664187.1 HmuY family protein [Bacteroidales bacterium]
MNFFRFPLALGLLLMLTSCFKDDDKVDPKPRSEVVEATIPMTQNYQNQVFFDLSEETQSAPQLKTNYDLLFDAAPQGWRVWLNTAVFMKVAHTGTNQWDAVTDTTGLKWVFDKSDGNPDSNAVAVWLDTVSGISHREVMVLDRGLDLVGRSRGIYKLVIDSVSPDGYSIRFARLNNSDPKVVTVFKTDLTDLTGLLLDDNGRQVDPFPASEAWDLFFTQYTTLLYTSEGQAYPYLVTGVLINRLRIEVAEDSSNRFQSIDRDEAATLNYTNQLDALGYDWKQVQGDVTTGNVNYVVRQGVTYVLHERQGFYYKLRFTGFYSNSGEKGFPKFEFQRL